MMRWAIIFLVVAVIAAIFGFGGIASSAAGAAKIVFVVALILAVVGFIMGRGAGSALLVILGAGSLLAASGTARAASASTPELPEHVAPVLVEVQS